MLIRSVKPPLSPSTWKQKVCISHYHLYPRRIMSRKSTGSTMEQLEILRRQYFSIYPIFKLDLPPAQILIENQLYLISHILDDPNLAQYAPEAGYQKSFWRKVVAQLEYGLRGVMELDPDSVCLRPLQSSELKDRR